MKQFVYKGVLFLSIYLVLRVVLYSFIPYHWGNVWYSSKIQNLEKSGKYPEVVFIGSSRVYRQIDPALFDNLYFSQDSTGFSYNLGAPATFCPQTYYLYENFLESEVSKNCKVVFFELLPVTGIEEKLLHQERSTYWLNASEYFFLIKSISGNPLKTFSDKFYEWQTYTSSYIESILGLGHFRDEVLDWNYYSSELCGPELNGFYALDDELNRNKSDALKKRKKELNMDNLARLKNQAVRIHKSKDLLTPHQVDHTNIDRVNQLIALSANKGISIVFFISPRMVSQELLALAQQVKGAPVIDLSNPTEFPEFYEYRYLFDNGHLNKAGAIIYTEALFKKYASLKNKE